MMQISRRQRREATYKSTRRRFFLCMVCMVWGGFLYWMWYFPNPFFFTFTSMITFFQLIMLNPYKLRSYLPGLTASNYWLKTSTIVGYIIVFFLLMSSISNLER